jgi:hypothetical protein
MKHDWYSLYFFKVGRLLYVNAIRILIAKTNCSKTALSPEKYVIPAVSEITDSITDKNLQL